MAKGKRREKFTRFNLVTGEDTYASQTAQDPATSRRVQSLIPSLAGDLRREKPNPTYLGNVGAAIGHIFGYDHNNTDGTVTRYYFCATATKLFQNVANAWVQVTLPLANGTSSATPLAAYPQHAVLNNVLHLSDGTTSWIYDGTSWVLGGMAIPLSAPAVVGVAVNAMNITGAVRLAGTVTITLAATINSLNGYLSGNFVLVIAGVTNATFNGTFACKQTGASTFTYLQPNLADATSGTGTATPTPLTIAVNRYYWISFLDQTRPANCQSDASPSVAAVPAPAFTSGVTGILITPRAGQAQVTGTSVASTLGALFTQDDVGKVLWVSGNRIGFISVVDATGDLVTLISNGFGNITGYFAVAPDRATHWVIYASESENSKIGNQLAIVALNYTATVGAWHDTSPFNSNPNNLFLPIERPIRNDPPVASKIQEVHKFRVFRRRDSKPNLVNYTANEEVRGNLNGSPEESTPGTNINSLSDITNEQPYPDSSHIVRAICSHGEACYFGSEKNVLPLYGQSIDDFTLSQLYAFQVGVAGRFAMVSTPHGLVFVSYDRKVYLYPSQGVPANDDATTSLIELSRPKRTTFEQIKSSDLDNVRLKFYNFGRRNWLVLAYQDNNSVYHTWVYDFETKGWFELQRGVVSLAVLEVSEGNMVLMGGGVDGQVYVLDDLTGTYSSNGNYPVGTFRPALIDWGKPDHYHVFRYLEFEVSNFLLGLSSMTVKYWLDPVDVDNPGVESGVLTISQVKGSNFFRGFARGGSLCYRLLLEFSLAADTNDGVIRGINIVADEASGLIF